MTLPTLGERIQQARKFNNWSRAELARKVGVKPSAAVQWEQIGGTSPSTPNLIRLAKLTNVSFEWLATGRGSLQYRAAEQDVAIDMGSFAQNSFEERLLQLARLMPTSAHDPLVRFIAALLAVPVRSKKPGVNSAA